MAAAEDGTVQMPGELLAEARISHEDQVRTTLAAEATAVHISRVLGAAGVTAVWLKGLSAAHLDYPDPAWRNSVDVDLLIPRDAAAVALSALQQDGAERARIALGAEWERKFARSIELNACSGVEIDLHLAIAVGYFGVRLDHHRLLAAPQQFNIAGTSVAALRPSSRLLATAYAVVLSRGSSERLQRDLAQQLLVTGADWVEAVALAGEGALVIERALHAAAEAIPPLREHPLLEQRQRPPNRGALRALQLAESAQISGWADDARSTLRGLPLRDRPRFVLGIVFPSRESRIARSRTRTAHLRRLVRLNRFGGAAVRGRDAHDPDSPMRRSNPDTVDRPLGRHRRARPGR